MTNTYWKTRAEEDQGQSTKNPHILAARIIAEVKLTGRQVTHEDINTVLEHQKIEITAEELNQLKAITYTEYSMLDLVGKEMNFAIYNAFNQLYPKLVPVGTGRWGLYKLINNTSGAVYVGSSIVLGERIRHYWKDHRGNVRKVLLDIRTTGITNFTLRIFELPVQLREMRLLLALEQVPGEAGQDMLTDNPDNNTLYVANGNPGGMAVAEHNRELNSQPVYLYKNGVLVATFSSKNTGPNSATEVLGISRNVVADITDTATLLYQVFLLTTEELPGTLVELLPLEDLLMVVENARVVSKSAQGVGLAGTSKSVTLTRISDGEVYTFASVGKAAEWLAEEAKVKVWKRYLKKHNTSRLPLHGFTVTYL